MSSALARPLLRRQAVAPLRNVAARRFESSAASTAQKTAESAKNAAADYKSKATEGLSRVTSAAGPAIAGAAKGLSSALGKVGGRTGRFIGFVERMFMPFVLSRKRLEDMAVGAWEDPRMRMDLLFQLEQLLTDSV